MVIGKGTIRFSAAMGAAVLLSALSTRADAQQLVPYVAQTFASGIGLQLPPLPGRLSPRKPPDVGLLPEGLSSRSRIPAASFNGASPPPDLPAIAAAARLKTVAGQSLTLMVVPKSRTNERLAQSVTRQAAAGTRLGGGGEPSPEAVVRDPRDDFESRVESLSDSRTTVGP